MVEGASGSWKGGSCFCPVSLLSSGSGSGIGLSHKALPSWCPQLGNRSGTEGNGVRRRHYQVMLIIILMNIY